jgi:hypothetical protein
MLLVDADASRRDLKMLCICFVTLSGGSPVSKRWQEIFQNASTTVYCATKSTTEETK